MGLLEIMFEDRLATGKRKPAARLVLDKEKVYKYLNAVSPKKSLEDKASKKKL